MLSVTPTAAEAIDGILDASEADENAGVRIEAQGAENGAEQAGFALAVAPEPEPEDTVIADGKVFLEPQASVALEESRLDATLEEGQVRFSIEHTDG